MGTFTEEIILENSEDRLFANRGYIKESEVRVVKVQAMPDTGAWTLVINEEVLQQLGLAIEGETTSTLADGASAQYKITAPVKIQWKNRSTKLPSVVIPGAQEVLLGALPLEAMDLIVDPVRKTLAGAHGDQPLHVLY
ncbi:MAG: aspartyl protease family protein [Treponema sp.]|jgi:clan AA aspartic protease|nr:aspartyl protease family protein [Treponema sp.]